MHLLIKFLVAGDSQREDGAGPSCMTYSFVSVLNGSEILQEPEKNTSIYFPRFLAQPTNTISSQKDLYSLSQQGLPVPKTAQLLKKQECEFSANSHITICASKVARNLEETKFFQHVRTCNYRVQCNEGRRFNSHDHSRPKLFKVFILHINDRNYQRRCHACLKLQSC